MARRLIVVVVVVLAGVAIAVQLRGRGGAVTPEQAFTPRAGASEGERIADLEKALAAQVDRANQLESRLGELEGRWGARGEAATSLEARGERMQFRQRFADAEGNFDPAAMRQRMREDQLQRLVDAGFTRERAEWIERRAQELQLQAQQAQFDAQRNGQPMRGGVDIQSALRKELGDAEYERYLTGTGRPTNVQVMEVLASSAAERAGLQAGDQIVSYAGMRVFEMSEVSALTRQGTPGETVTVEVRRDGQTVQLQVPRGVLGVQGGGPGGGGGGPPGGFRGAGPGGMGGG